jgi:hypothetical protein
VDTAWGDDRFLPMDVVDAIDLEDLLRSLGNTGGEGGGELYLSDGEYALDSPDTGGGLDEVLRALGHTGGEGSELAFRDTGGGGMGAGARRFRYQGGGMVRGRWEGRPE